MRLLPKTLLSIATATALISLTTAADKDVTTWKLPEETVKLQPAEGVELVTVQCSLCHSADYISTQPPLTRAAWTATITKMRDKYAASIPTNTVDQLVTYLAKTYGTERPK